MHSHAQKTPGNESQSAANKPDAQQQPGSGFADNRGIAMQMGKLKELAGNSAAVKQLKAMQAMANQSVQAKHLKNLQARASNGALHEHGMPIQKKRNDTGLPDNLKAGIENMSGYAMDDVKVHYNSDKPASLHAHAYAQGTDIHVASGQEKHLPHEAWHVVQQKQGRVKPTLQMKDGAYVNDDTGLENEADVMGEKSIQMFAARSPDQDPLPQKGVNSAGTIFQRVVAYKGVQYKVPQALYDANAGLMDRLMDDATKEFKMGNLTSAIKDPAKVFDLMEETAGKFTLTESKDPVQGELLAASAATQEVDLNARTKAYTNEKTYFVKIDEGAAILKGKGDPVEVIGTSGLRGCVAVMIMCENRGNNAYFVAHVNSAKASHIDLITAEIERILATLNETLKEKLKWSDFDPRSPNKLLLAREKGEDQTLFINMQDILAKSGAKMLATEHGNIAIDVRGEDGKFIRHESATSDAPEPELPYENRLRAMGYDGSHFSNLMRTLEEGGVDIDKYMNRKFPPGADVRRGI